MLRPEQHPPCPACGSDRVAWVFYGLPVSFEAFESDLAEGRVALGGCCLSEGDPEWTCSACGHGWGRPAILVELRRLLEDSAAPPQSFWQRFRRWAWGSRG